MAQNKKAALCSASVMDRIREASWQLCLWGNARHWTQDVSAHLRFVSHREARSVPKPHRGKILRRYKWKGIARRNCTTGGSCRVCLLIRQVLTKRPRRREPTTGPSQLEILLFPFRQGPAQNENAKVSPSAHGFTRIVELGRTPGSICGTGNKASRKSWTPL